MAKLRLGVAPQNIKVLNQRQPPGFLLFIGKVFDGQTEHGHRQTDSWELTLEVICPIDVRRSNHWVDEKLLFVVLVQHVYSFPKVLLHLVGG